MIYTVKANVYRLKVSNLQLMAWYGKWVNTREATLPYTIVHEAMIDLQADDADKEGVKAPDEEVELDLENYWTDVEEDEEEAPVIAVVDVACSATQ